MDVKALMPSAIALAILYGISHFVKNPMVKAGAYGAMGVILAKQVPYVKTPWPNRQLLQPVQLQGIT